MYRAAEGSLPGELAPGYQLLLTTPHLTSNALITLAPHQEFGNFFLTNLCPQK